ncbi:hypothetical protein [Sphaerochaeta globosa]|uniref:Uncharacterized protein n=1 Tax=Sphaerochaeta globosa (strain ATCC BAA-1886 / DSM 22777 / Buddy) TaxID=158189 RepID=F0RXZ9_SPHGB|nr:hypothetical protein [Sphaerochaeta globosa]ADY12423.1 hypothetical protein SpiBuddy_0590 [Sphaerochaeta globosa str. Buddy]
MKKNIVAVLLVIALSTVSAFAVDPASFNVSTAVNGINKMKITQAAFSGTTPASFNSALAFVGPLGVTTSGPQTFSAYLSTMSNNRIGYKVTMGATAMTSAVAGQTTSYINYTVGVNTKSLTTAGATVVTPVEVITVASLTGLASQSHAISLSVDATSFDAAVEGTYSGTVTFTYTAN